MRRALTLILVVLLTAGQAWADVAYVTSNSAKDVSGASTTVTIASVDCSGANTACKVDFAWRQNAGQTFTSITHPSSSVTTLTSSNCQNGGCFVSAYICNGGGSGNLVATVSAAANTFIAYTQVSGVDCAGTPVGTTVVSDSSGGAGTTVTTNVTTTAGGMALDGHYLRDDGANNVPTAGQTQRQTQSDAGSMGLFTSTKPHTATSLGWTWTVDGSLHYVHSVTPFNAASAGGPPKQMMTLGVGEQGPEP